MIDGDDNESDANDFRNEDGSDDDGLPTHEGETDADAALALEDEEEEERVRRKRCNDDGPARARRGILRRRLHQ